MFKSIHYKLVVFVCLLILSVGAAVWAFVSGHTVSGIISVMVAVIALSRLWHHYRKFNLNILFLLNALENGDYSFHFSVTKLSRRERELNTMLNRIKEILAAARREVIENEQFLSLIVDSVSTGIFIVGENGSVRSANTAAMRMLGMNVFTHINQLSNIDASLPEIIGSLGLEGKAQIRIPNEREEQLLSMRVNRIGLRNGLVRVVTLSNIKSELEEQEMESWVKLIRVMTHEIMNSIAPISSLSDTLIGAHRVAGAADNLSQTTVEAMETINSTAKGLLSFVDSYRKFTGVPKPDMKPVDLGELLQRVAKLAAADAAPHCVRIESTGEDGPEVMADESQVSQVLVNLIKNASEALDQTERGNITVAYGTEASRAFIAVSNCGRPIPPETLPHIFVPFFTTKQSGTGVGLSISRYIMRMHGGNLTHHRAGGTTTFRMVF